MTDVSDNWMDDNSLQGPVETNDPLASSEYVVTEEPLSVVWQPQNLQSEIGELCRDLLNITEIDHIGVSAREYISPEFYDLDVMLPLDLSLSFGLSPQLASTSLFNNGSPVFPRELSGNNVSDGTLVQTISEASVDAFNLGDHFLFEAGDFGNERRPPCDSIRNSGFLLTSCPELDSIDYNTTFSADSGMEISAIAETVTFGPFMKAKFAESKEANTMLTETSSTDCRTTVERGVQTEDSVYIPTKCQACCPR